MSSQKMKKPLAQAKTSKGAGDNKRDSFQNYCLLQRNSTLAKENESLKQTVQKLKRENLSLKSFEKENALKKVSSFRPLYCFTNSHFRP